MRNCPNCSQPLAKVTFHGIELDSCESCGGIWFDGGEMQRVKTASPDSWPSLEAEVAPRAEEHKATRPGLKRCPVCGTDLMPYKFMYRSEIVLDECENCEGIWVDDTELLAMAEFAKAIPDVDRKYTDEVLHCVAELDAMSQENRLRSSVVQFTMNALGRRRYL